MTELPYFKISTLLHVDDGLDAAPVDIEIIPDDQMTISREHTPADGEFPDVPGFEVCFSIEAAKELRDFLNYALPKNTDA
jgi:hypothetical protein